MKVNRITILTLISALILITGCVTMVPLRKSARTAKVDKRSLLLLRFATMNHYDPVFTPKLTLIQFYNLDTRKRFRYGPQPESQSCDALGYNHFWMALFLPPGEYLIEKLEGLALETLIPSSFQIKPFTKFSLPPQSISYAGLLEISNGKPTQDGVSVQSSSIPMSSQGLLGSALSGYLDDGTFRVRLIDNHQEDIVSYRYFYPCLAQREILINLAKQ